MNSMRTFNLLIGTLWGDQDAESMLSHVVASDREGNPLKLGVDRNDRRFILTPIDQSFSFAGEMGAAIELGEWRKSGDDQRHLAITCSSPELAEVFGAFADNIVHRVEAENSTTEAMLVAMKDWKRLFKPAPAISQEVARGLFGELWVLQQLASRNPHIAVQRWTGPDGDPHDFMSEERHLEVKTSQSEGLGITVSSLAQLDTVGDVPLALVRLRVRGQPEGRNIGDMVEELTRMGAYRHDLVLKLGEMGFVLGADPDEHRFTVVDDPVIWEVNDDFPGLRSRDIPEERREAITRVSYTLDLLSAPGRLEDSDALDVLVDQLVAQ